MNPGVKEGYYQKGANLHYIDQINLSFLLERITLSDLTAIVKANPIYNEEYLSLQAQDADKDGNVLQIFPGLGYKILAKPAYSVLTNFQLDEGRKRTSSLGWSRPLRESEQAA
jgi:hypothetical protein